MSTRTDKNDATAVAADQRVLDALRKLREGHERFLNARMRHPNLDAQTRSQAARQGQEPFAAILSCSDSRVPVEHIFDVGVGDLFIVRIPGNICRSDAVGAMEYAVGHLNVPVCMVMGHSQCGAVAGYMAGGHADGCLGRLLAGIGPAAKEARRAAPNADPETLVEFVIRINIGRAVDTLVSRSELIRDRLEKGQVSVTGCYYRLADGVLEWIQPPTSRET